MILLHLLLADPGVGGAAEEYHPIGYPPKERLNFAVPVGGQHRLRASFSCAGDIVREGWGHLNLETSDVADGKTKNTSSYHHGPEREVAIALEWHQRR